MPHLSKLNSSFTFTFPSLGDATSSAITCSSMALADAGIEMYDLVAACTVVKVDFAFHTISTKPLTNAHNLSISPPPPSPLHSPYLSLSLPTSLSSLYLSLSVYLCLPHPVFFRACVCVQRCHYLSVCLRLCLFA